MVPTSQNRRQGRHGRDGCGNAILCHRRNAGRQPPRRSHLRNQAISGATIQPVGRAVRGLGWLCFAERLASNTEKQANRANSPALSLAASSGTSEEIIRTTPVDRGNRSQSTNSIQRQPSVTSSTIPAFHACRFRARRKHFRFPGRQHVPTAPHPAEGTERRRWVQLPAAGKLADLGRSLALRPRRTSVFSRMVRLGLTSSPGAVRQHRRASAPVRSSSDFEHKPGTATSSTLGPQYWNGEQRGRGGGGMFGSQGRAALGNVEWLPGERRGHFRCHRFRFIWNIKLNPDPLRSTFHPDSAHCSSETHPVCQVRSANRLNDAGRPEDTSRPLISPRRRPPASNAAGEVRHLIPTPQGHWEPDSCH